MKLKNVADVYALSPVQQLMLTHALSGVHEDVLHEQLTCTLLGVLDHIALRNAWQAVVDRHPALRTAFAWKGLKKPLQIVRQQVQLPWRLEDWRNLSTADQERQWAEWIAADREQPFPLTLAPLMRVTLVQTADEVHRFVWSCHHAILDGWCLGLILREVLTIYEALSHERQPHLAAIVPFRDYVAWLAKQDPEAEASFWRRYLQGYRRPVRIASRSEGREATLETGSSGEMEIVLPADLTAGLRLVAAQEQVTLSTVIEAAWCLLLARYTGCRDIVYGCAVSGRSPEVKGVEAIVGPFANVQPVRVSVDREHRLGHWMRQLQAQKAELLLFEYSGADQVQRWSELPAGQSLFESLIVFENYPLDATCFQWAPTLRIADVHGTATAESPLLLVVFPGDLLRIRLRYQRMRGGKQKAECILRHLETLLRAVVQQPQATAIELPLEEMPASFPAHELRATSTGHPDSFESVSQQRLGQMIDQLGSAWPSGTLDRAILLDAWGQPAPSDVPGTLYLGGTRFAPQLADPIPPARFARWLNVGGERSCWIDSHERVCRGLDGRLHFCGTEDHPLEILRYRVDPAWLGDLIRQHTLIRDAGVVAWRDILGETRLVAYLVPTAASSTLLDTDQHALLLDEIRRYLLERLPAELLPRTVILPELPRGSDGQLDETALPEPLQPRPALGTEFVAPRDPVEVELADLWSDLLGVHPIGVHDNFAELGGRSVLALSLITRIEERFARAVPIVALYGQPTIAHLSQWLRRPAGAEQPTTLVAIQPGGTQRPLFCVHPAGGTVFCYVELAGYLGGDLPVFGLQAQGIDGRQSPHTTVEEMAACYAQAIRARFAHGPYRLCGWSTGGIIAFEVARQLQEHGETVELLALFDAGMPALEDQPFDKDDLLPLLTMMFPGQSAEELSALQQSSFEQQLNYFQQRAELAQLLVGDAGNARHVYDVFQANVQAITQYRPRPWPGRLTLFRAAIPSTPMHRDSCLGWKSYVNDVVLHEIPGDHVNMFRKPAIETLAAILAARLAEL